ncbi:MAG: hypothetical protein AAGA30_02040 [Planctomycetota bacterium]
MMNTNWQISLHFCFDNEQLPIQPLQWRGQQIQSLAVNAEQLNEPFPMSFDKFIDGVNELDGGYAEGDGSYGIVGPQGNWKICGNIFEFTDSIQYVDLLGSCPQDRFIEFLNQLGVNSNQCVIQHLQGGFFQSPQQFFDCQ